MRAYPMQYQAVASYDWCGHLHKTRRAAKQCGLVTFKGDRFRVVSRRGVRKEMRSG